jgi:hypothetical protein
MVQPDAEFGACRWGPRGQDSRQITRIRRGGEFGEGRSD